MVTPKHPPVLWAQRQATLLLTIAVEDMSIDVLNVTGNKFEIKGKNKAGDEYATELELHADLEGSELRKVPTTRQVELVIPKKTAEWWPRLLKASTKVPWVKVDFNKWVDEDEENEEDPMFPSGAQGWGDFGMGGGGQPDFSSLMGSLGGGPDGPLNDDDEDDDDEMPPLDETEDPLQKPMTTAAADALEHESP